MNAPQQREGLDGPWSRARLCALVALLAGGPAACSRKAARMPPAPAVTPTPVASETRGTLAPARYALRPAERAAVEGFLRRHPELRPPEENDRRVSASGQGDLRHLYGVYHPYFVRGDLNDDGILDFVMGFVRRESSKSTPWFTVVVFPGTEVGASGPAFGSETFLERDITLAAGDLSIDRDSVVITPDLEDDAARRYRWDPSRRSYVFVRDDETEFEPPDLSQT